MESSLLSDKLLVLVDRSDRSPGDFDIMYNYNGIQWETGDASSGSGGLNGTSAHVGYSNGSTTSFELPGSGVNGAFLDSNTASGLVYNDRNSTQPGRYIFAVRNGVAPTGGSISGSVYANSSSPSNALAAAFVQVCSTAGFCQTTSTNSSGQYIVSGLDDGQYNVTAFPPGGSTLFQGTIGPLTLANAAALTGQDIVLTGPTPPPPGTTITNRYTDNSGIPVLNWNDQLTLTTQGCAGGTATYQMLQDATVIRSGSMTEGPAGTYTAAIAPLAPIHGNAHVNITIACPGGSTTTTPFDIYIDPSGTVQTTDGAPLSGATVTLLRSDSSSGPFQPVPNGSGIMSIANRNNPDVSDANGHFGWDVVAGYYVVRASKAGCAAPNDPTQAYVDSPVLTIPPAVTNLVLNLNCSGADVTAPGTTASLSPQANANGWNNGATTVTLGASDNAGGSGVASTYYAVDDDTCTPSVPGRCTAYSGPFTVSGEGRHIVYYFSADHAGNLEPQRSLLVRIDTTPPHTSASVSGTQAGGNYQAPVMVTLSPADNLSGVASTAYQTDGGSVQTYSAPFSVAAPGNHTVSFYSTDNAGNAEQPQSTSFTINASPTVTPPPATTTPVPPAATPVPPAAPTSMPNPPVVAPANTAVPPSAPPTTAPTSAVTIHTPAPTSTVAHNATIIQPTATRTPISQVAGVTRTQPTCARPAVTRILVNGKALTKGTQLLSGQMVAVRVHAAPRMRVQTLIDLTHTVTTTTGTGRHRKTVKRTVVVGHVAATATTNRTGDATGYARIAYVPATTAMVALKVGAHAACGGSVTLASSAMRLKPTYVTPMVGVSLPNGKAVSGATIKTNSVIVVRVNAAENTPVKIAVTLHVQGSKEGITYTAPSSARQAEPRTGKLDGYLMEQVRIPYEPRHYKVGATLAVTVSARSTVGKKQRTVTATTGALHVTLQSERPPQRVRHR